jgi:hypothetical protein
MKRLAKIGPDQAGRRMPDPDLAGTGLCNSARELGCLAFNRHVDPRRARESIAGSDPTARSGQNPFPTASGFLRLSRRTSATGISDRIPESPEDPVIFQSPKRGKVVCRDPLSGLPRATPARPGEPSFQRSRRIFAIPLGASVPGKSSEIIRRSRPTPIVESAKPSCIKKN